MARHEGFVSCAPLVAVVLVALLPLPARSAGFAPPPEGPPGDVQELLLRRGRPDLHAVGTAECVAYVAGTARERPVLWYLFPRRGEAGRLRIVQGLGPDGLAEVAEACGPVAARYARIVDATCSEPAALLELLRSPELLSYRVPELPTHLRWARHPERGHLALADDIGCARVVTSRDGRVRIWTPLRERLVDPEENDPAGAGVRRGVAFVQALGDEGQISVHRDRTRGEDLHLDSVVDAVEPVPGARHRYLVIGIRSFEAPSPGPLPRRYAFVMQLGVEGPRLVRETFLVGTARRDVLLLQGPEPATGDFRFHSFGWRHLAFSADDGALRLTWFAESLPLGAPRRRLDVATVAQWENGLFRVHGRSWYASVESPGDARAWISDRWGGIAEIGERDFDEILGMGGDGVSPPAARGRGWNAVGAAAQGSPTMEGPRREIGRVRDRRADRVAL